MSDKVRDTIDVSAERPVVTPDANAQFLNEFLSEKPTEDAAKPAPEAEGTPSEPETGEEGSLKEDIIAALKEIYDPEIPVNIYELGLIYDVEVDDSAFAKVTMTLTTPHCPVAESMPGEVEIRVSSVPGVSGAEVQLVWDPPWDMGKMSDEARLELGLL